MAEVCKDCGRPKARGGAEWNIDYQSARSDENSATCGRHLPSYWSDEAVPDCDRATIAHLRSQLALANKVIAAADETRAVSCGQFGDAVCWPKYDAAREKLRRMQDG